MELENGQFELSVVSWTLKKEEKCVLISFFNELKVPIGSYANPKRLVIDRISSVVHRGVSRDGRLIGRGACDQEQEGNRDTRVIQVQAVSTT